MFQFKQEQFARLRRKKIGDGLIASFGGGPMRARWNEQKNYVVATDPLENNTRFGFDEHGFIAAVASPTGRLWQMANYPDGKAAALKNPAGHQLTLGYTPDGQLQSIASDGKLRLQLHYNEQQKAVGTSFPDGTFSSIEYTPWGAPWVTTNRLGLRDVYDYDEHRRLTALTDGNGISTSFLYGVWNRPDRTVFPNQSSESYLYNEKGFVTNIATEESSVTLEPDDKGRPKSLRYSDGFKIGYKYDDLGRATAAELSIPGEEEPLASKYVWNDAGQLESEQSGEVSLLYEYDQAGRLIALIYPSGEKIGYEWDADSRLTLVRDWNGGEHSIEYAPSDRGNLLTAANGIQTLTLLNNLGHPENIAVSSQGNALFSLGYTYDGEDRVAALRDSAFGYREFQYDPEGQLLAANSQGEGPTETFSYDGAGNHTDISDKPAQHDPANQLIAFGHSRYDYDCRGNLLRMDTAEGIWRFAWSARNLMIASESPAGVLTTYDYDAFGRRIRKQHNGLTVDFTWAGEQMIGEVITTSDSVVRRDYVYFPGTFTPLAVRVDGQVYSYHCDHLGTPRMITAPDGATVWLADYMAYGSARIAHSSFDNPLRAPGQYFDEETGLHYNRFRYYSPELARYLSRDPLGFLAGSNVYRYAGNNPINQGDPLGLLSWQSVGIIVASVAVAVAVVALAPVALPLAIVLGGAAAGAVAGGLNQALNEDQFCLPCILKAAGLGALMGAASALPFAFLPATAGVAAFMGAGALGGAAGYTTNYLDGGNPNWSWKDFGKSVALGGATAGVAKFAGQAITGKLSPATAPASRVATQPDEAFFWSGRSKAPDGTVFGGSDNARLLAQKSGGTTLETLIDERGIDMPDWDPNDPSSVAAWKQISSEYAQGASGQVRVVLGSELRPGNVWETAEFPALQANPNVTQIVSVDPATGESAILWTR